MKNLKLPGLMKLRDYIKTKPRLYDCGKKLMPCNRPEQKFFEKFSKLSGKGVSFIQIGSSDGLRGDPIRKYVVSDAWRGVFVEPLPDVFEMLKLNYSYLGRSDLLFVNAAIVPSNREFIQFWTYSDEFLEKLNTEEKLLYLRKASCDRNHVLRTLYSEADGRALKKPNNSYDPNDSNPCTGSGSLDQILKAVEVPCLTINQLVEKNWARPLDILVMDAEGYDGAILRSIDFSSISPRVIFFEAHNIQNEMEAVKDFLKLNGYAVFDMGGDSIAVRKDDRRTLSIL